MSTTENNERLPEYSLLTSDDSLLGEVCIFWKFVPHKCSRASDPESELSFNLATSCLCSGRCDVLGVVSTLKYSQEKDSELVRIKAKSNFHHYNLPEKIQRKVTLISQPNPTNSF